MISHINTNILISFVTFKLIISSPLKSFTEIAIIVLAMGSLKLELLKYIVTIHLSRNSYKGNGYFTYSEMIFNTCDWDTNCNAGNLGSILGILNDIKGINSYWINPIKDVIISSSCIGSLNIDTISNSEQRFATLGCKYAGKPIPTKWQENTFNDCLFFHFDIPNSIQGFRVDDNTIIKK